MSANLLTRLGRKIAAAMEAYYGNGGYGCCTCGNESPDGVYYEYQNACTNEGYWDWVQCGDCHDGTGEHDRWMRTLPWRRLVATK